MNDSLASDQTSAGPASSAFETALKGAQEGAADAMEAAKQLIPAAGRFFENFGYNSGYAVAFGVVFPAALIARLFPSDNPVAHGFVDGARAAIDLVRESKKASPDAPASDPVQATA
ncbi:MAG: hypothetical protein ACLQIB_27915 [Isosphaeraceae bacterium]